MLLDYTLPRKSISAQNSNPDSFLCKGKDSFSCNEDYVVASDGSTLMKISDAYGKLNYLYKFTDSLKLFWIEKVNGRNKHIMHYNELKSHWWRKRKLGKEGGVKAGRKGWGELERERDSFLNDLLNSSLRLQERST